MPIILRCPSCQAPLAFAEEQVGRHFHCPRCGIRVLVPAESDLDATGIAAGEPPLWPSTPSLPPLPDRSEHVTQRPVIPVPPPVRRSSRSGWEDDSYQRLQLDRMDPSPDISIGQDPHAWRLVRVGLTMVHAGITALFVIALAGVFLIMCLIFQSPHISRWLDWLWIGILGSIGLCILVACVGQCLCCAVPSESGARGHAVGAAICLLISMLAATAQYLFSLPMLHEALFPERGALGGSVVHLMMTLLLTGSAVVGHILFVLFLRQVACCFRNYQVIQSVGSYLILYGIFVVSYLLLITLPALAWGRAITYFACFAFVMLIVMLMLLVWYLRLVMLTRDTIAAWMT